VPIYRRLPRELREQLHGHINVFLGEKEFEGCGGLTLTDEIRVTIAAQACVLLLNRETDYFPGFRTVLVYPETYVAPGTHIDGPIETHGEDIRAGESWHRGPVVLSWGDVMRGTSAHGAAHNVVLHEFAHKLDEENEHSDGLPVLPDSAQQKTWAEVLGREYHALQAAAEKGGDSVLDHYGATSPAEFFAVATETFFETPVALKGKHALLYEELKKFYNVDPFRWQREAG
jgi:MtfA peptidase